MSTSFKKTIFFYLPILIWLFIIFLASSYPGSGSVGFDLYKFTTRKAAHIILYAVLAFLILRALKFNRKKLTKTQIIAAAIFCLLYAISDEYHQSLTIFRTPNPIDVGFDVVGIYLGLRLFGIIKTKKNTK